MELICADDQNSAMVFGPMPGSFISSRMLKLYFASSSSRRGVVPVPASALMLAAMLLPIPGISSSFAASSQIAARSEVVCVLASATLR